MIQLPEEIVSGFAAWSVHLQKKVVPVQTLSYACRPCESVAFEPVCFFCGQDSTPVTEIPDTERRQLTLMNSPYQAYYTQED